MAAEDKEKIFQRGFGKNTGASAGSWSGKSSPPPGSPSARMARREKPVRDGHTCQGVPEQQDGLSCRALPERKV
ncbi:hypothetical protein [Methanoregula sp.]|uniref:hypothetical protein n=1 Tax=Methanoregula sp. TaxID=2052170 RepID=UPI003C78A226